MPGHERSTSERVYGALLFAYPKEFREEYGPHMAQAFADLCQEERRRGGRGRLAGLWARTLVDLAASVFAERSRRWGTMMFSSSFVRWAGLAAMLGGVLGLFYTGVFEVLAMPGVLESESWRLWLRDLNEGAVVRFWGSLGGALVTAGILGFYALLDRRSRLGQAGVASVCLSFVVSLIITLYLWYVGPQLGFVADEVPLVFTIGSANGLLGLAGMLLLGVAALRSRTRPLGRWGVLPIILAVLGTPFPLFLVSHLGGSSIGFWTAALMALPGVLSGVTWMALGYVLCSFGGDLRHAAVAVGSAAPSFVGPSPSAPASRDEVRAERPAATGRSGRRGRTAMLALLAVASSLVVIGVAFGTTQVGGDPGSNLEDRLVGGNGQDTLDGLGDGDLVRGEGGDDTLSGGYGDDEVHGGPGNDTISGDYLGEEAGGGNGDVGSDALYGGTGDDRIFADEKIYVGGKKDFVYCGPGQDFAEVSPTDVVAEDCEEVVRQEFIGP